MPKKTVSKPADDYDEKTFKGKYKLGKVLGKGGYSIVYECTNKQTKVRYAVKQIVRANLKEEDEIGLRQEIEILRELKHPHIIQFFDFFEDPTTYYVVLEVLDGGELFDRIVQKSCYNEKEARDLVVILLTSIKYIHDNNVVHRFDYAATHLPVPFLTPVCRLPQGPEAGKLAHGQPDGR